MVRTDALGQFRRASARDFHGVLFAEDCMRTAEFEGPVAAIVFTVHASAAGTLEEARAREPHDACVIFNSA